MSEQGDGLFDGFRPVADPFGFPAGQGSPQAPAPAPEPEPESAPAAASRSPRRYSTAATSRAASNRDASNLPAWYQGLGEVGGYSFSLRRIHPRLQYFGQFTQRLEFDEIVRLVRKAGTFEVQACKARDRGPGVQAIGAPRRVEISDQDLVEVLGIDPRVPETAPSALPPPGSYLPPGAPPVPPGIDPAIASRHDWQFNALGQQLATMQQLLYERRDVAEPREDPHYDRTGSPLVSSAQLDEARRQYQEDRAHLLTAMDDAMRRVKEAAASDREMLQTSHAIRVELEQGRAKEAVKERDREVERGERLAAKVAKLEEDLADRRRDLDEARRKLEDEQREIRRLKDDLRRAETAAEERATARGAATPVAALSAFLDERDATEKVLERLGGARQRGADPDEGDDATRTMQRGSQFLRDLREVMPDIKEALSFGRPAPAPPPAPGALPGAGPSPAGPAPEAANLAQVQSVMTALDAAYASGRTPAEVYAEMRVAVGSAGVQAAAAMPSDVFVRQVYGALPGASRLRDLAGRRWLTALHGLVAEEARRGGAARSATQ